MAVYDPASKSWSSLAELIGEKSMAGFGVSGWSLAGELVVTTYEGDIQRWDEASQTWKLLGKTEQARFFHRILPWDDQTLVSIGGANMETGKFLEMELIPLP